MGVKNFKPTSPARRYYSVSDFKEISKDAEPLKKLLEHQTRTGGRNHYGRITSRFRGGGHKQRYRVIDWKRDMADQHDEWKRAYREQQLKMRQAQRELQQRFRQQRHHGRRLRGYGGLPG